MKHFLFSLFAATVICCLFSFKSLSQNSIKVLKVKGQKKIDVYIKNNLFTSFLYPDTLEKPVLYPILTSDGNAVTRGFPLNTQQDDPTDHPHHLGLWFNFENVNGLDFWNNSFAIPSEKKHLYGWIKTDPDIHIKSGNQGEIQYSANWTNQDNHILLKETTTYTFKSINNHYIIDRKTILQADTTVLFKDSKDGMLGLRVAHQLQMPIYKEQRFSDDKGNITIVKPDYMIPTGNYVTSENKTGNDAWGTRGKWCKLYGKMGNDSVSIVMIDHPRNSNYPTFWFTRGYGLFAANPLGERIFTNGASAKNLQLSKGESVTFQYRIVIDSNKKSITGLEIDNLVKDFYKE